MNALLVIDIQNDFLPGGSLAVMEGDEIIPVVNRLMHKGHFDVIAATRDWHPPDHGSFAHNHPGHKEGEVVDLNGLDQLLWPVHCVQNTPGAEFAGSLDSSRFDKVFDKGTEAHIDSYSGLYDNGHRRATGLSQWLKDQGVTEIAIVGLAADYCVKFTALDAAKDGFDTTVITDATHGVDVHPGDTNKAFAELGVQGVRLARSSTFLDLGAEASALYGS